MAKQAKQAGRLAGKRFAIVGKCGYHDMFRKQYESAIRAAGASVVAPEKAVPDYIVAGEGRGGRPPAAVGQLARKHPSAEVLDGGALCRLLLPTADELLAVIRSDRRDHDYWESLRQFSFTGKVTTSLAGADLRGVDLWGANLTHVNLDGADLRGATAQYANFRALSGAKFDGADLVNAYLENAERCSFRKAAMASAWFDHGDGDTYRDCDFTGAALAQARGENCSFLGCVFNGADLSDVEMEKSDFSGVSFVRAKLSRAHLSGRS